MCRGTTAMPASQQLGLGGQQVNGRVAALGLIDRPHDPAGGVADTQDLAARARARCQHGHDALVTHEMPDESLDAQRDIVGVGGEHRRAGGEVDDSVAAGEARRPLRDPLGAGDRIDERAAVFDGLRVTLRTALQPRWDRRLEDRSWVVAGRDGLAGEPVVQRPAVTDLHLRVACVERRRLRRTSRRGVGIEAARGERVGDLAASRRPPPTQTGRDASDLPLLVAALPGDAEPTRQFGAQRGLVDPVGGFGVLEYQPAVQRRPPAVGCLEEVGEDGVGVQLRVALARAAVRELRPQEPEVAAVLAVDAVTAEPSDARVQSHVADSGIHRGSLRLAHLAAGVVWGDRPQRRDRLRRGERHVPRRDPTVCPWLQRLAGVGVDAVEDHTEVLSRDLAGQAEVIGESATPHAGRFAVTGVVVVPIRSDLLDVVRDTRPSSTGTDRSDRGDHQQPPATADGTRPEEHQDRHRAASRRSEHTLALHCNATTSGTLIDTGAATPRPPSRPVVVASMRPDPRSPRRRATTRLVLVTRSSRVSTPAHCARARTGGRVWRWSTSNAGPQPSSVRSTPSTPGAAATRWT